MSVVRVVAFSMLAGCDALLGLRGDYKPSISDAADAMEEQRRDPTCSHHGTSAVSCDRGQAEEWKLEMPARSPPPSAKHGFVFDSDRDANVLVTGSTMKSEVWEWDGASWNGCNASLPGRTSFMLVYATKWKRTVLYGGRLSNPLRFSDEMWEWDGASWQSRNAPDPGGRFDGSMAFHEKYGEIVLHGGWRDTATLDGTTYLFDGMKWTRACGLAMQPCGPGARHGAGMAYDAKHGVVVEFGGETNAGTQNDTWVWTGVQWEEKKPATTPPPRVHPAMTYDRVHDVVVMFGGASGNTALSDTWEWDGNDWSPRASMTNGRTQTSIAFDRASPCTVLFGGAAVEDGAFLGDTWTYCHP